MLHRSCGRAALACGVAVFTTGVGFAQTSGFGSALSFDGINDEARSDANFDTQSLTVEAWVQVRSVGAPGFGGLAAWGRNTDASWEIALAGNGSLTFACNWNKADYRIATIAGVHVPNQWSHVAVTYDGSTARYYSNGVQVGSAAFNVPISTGGAGAWMGMVNQFPGVDEFFAGSVDDLRIWSVVRSADEIRCAMGRPLVGNETGLLAAYRFDDGAGQIILDSSANARDAYLGAAPGADSADPQWVTSGADYACITQLNPVATAPICPTLGATMIADLCSTDQLAYRWQRRGGIPPASPTQWVDVTEGVNADQGQVFMSAVGAASRTLRVEAPAQRWPFAAEVPPYEFRCIATGSCGSFTTNTNVLVVCPADIDCDGEISGDDVTAYFQAWDTGDIRGDFSGDGSVDGDDVVAFFARWEAGC